MQQQFQPEAAPLSLAPPETAPEEQSLSESETASAASSELVSKLLTDAQRKIQHRKILFWTSFAVVEGGILTTVLFASRLSHSILPVCFIPLSIVLLISIIMSSVKYDVDTLAKLGGVRAVGPLLEALQSGISVSEPRLIYNALTHLLPQMKASDAGLLTAKQRAILYRLLRWNVITVPWWPWFDDFKIAALTALGQIGDAGAVPIVERFARKRGGGSRGARIRQAAQDALPDGCAFT